MSRPLLRVAAGISEFAKLPTLSRMAIRAHAALQSAERPVATSATRLAAEAAAARESDDVIRIVDANPGLAKGPRDIDLPPWQKGRYGSAIGRAVHGALQTVDLASGEGLAGVCAAQAAAEGVLGKESIIEALARSAIDSSIVKAASAQRHWREVYVGVPYGDGVLEGYIDLLYENDDGLVVVDYKTDAWRSTAELDAKVPRYAVQLRAYADAVRQATKRPVGSAVLLFLRQDGAVPREVEVAPTEAGS